MEVQTRALFGRRELRSQASLIHIVLILVGMAPAVLARVSSADAALGPFFTPDSRG